MFTFKLENVTTNPVLPFAIRDNPQERIRFHGHDYVEVVLVRQGHASHVMRQDKKDIVHSIIKGDLFTILPGEIHCYRECTNFRIYNFCIGVDFLRSLSPDLEKLEDFPAFFKKERPFQRHQLHLLPMHFLEAESIIKKLKMDMQSTKPSKLLNVKLHVLDFLTTFFDGGIFNWRDSGHKVDERLFAAIEQMEKNPEPKFNLTQAARAACMSISSFSHKFKATVGMSPVDYHVFLRLEFAKAQLLSSSSSVLEIAMNNGFCDDNYFIRLFKKRYGVTPGKYRTLMKA